MPSISSSLTVMDDEPSNFSLLCYVPLTTGLALPKPPPLSTISDALASTQIYDYNYKGYRGTGLSLVSLWLSCHLQGQQGLDPLHPQPKLGEASKQPQPVSRWSTEVYQEMMKGVLAWKSDIARCRLLVQST